MAEETMTLPTAGALPGISGSHAPGIYVVDYERRTIEPVILQPAQTEQPVQDVPTDDSPQEQPIKSDN